MPRKPFNPDTAYGRKKLREQAEQYKQNLPNNERKDFDSAGVIILVVIIVIVVVIAMATGNEKGAAKWLSR